MEKEEWRDVVGFEGLYQVSSLGNVLSVRRKHPQSGAWIGGNTISKSNNKGYLHVRLWKNGKERNIFVHRLVAIAFIENKFGKKEVNHINYTPHDNRACNLEWATSQENYKHTEKTGRATIPMKKIAQINKKTGEVLKIWESVTSAAQSVGVSQSAISHAVSTGKKSISAGYIWRMV